MGIKKTLRALIQQPIRLLTPKNYHKDNGFFAIVKFFFRKK